jgi:hypothetical protein
MGVNGRDAVSVIEGILSYGFKGEFAELSPPIVAYPADFRK